VALLRLPGDLFASAVLASASMSAAAFRVSSLFAMATCSTAFLRTQSEPCWFQVVLELFGDCRLFNRVAVAIKTAIPPFYQTLGFICLRDRFV